MTALWALWFLLSLAAFVGMEWYAVTNTAPGDTLSANVKRLTRRLSQPWRAAFLVIFVVGACILAVHWLGWLG